MRRRRRLAAKRRRALGLRARASAHVLAGLAGLALGAAGSAAQAVRGHVSDAEYGHPIGGARVLLLDTGSVAVDSTRTDSAGRFLARASGPGRYLIHVEVDGYLSYSNLVELQADETLRHTVEMPVVSVAAALVMQEVIDREAAFQLPIEELCVEPLRPWEAGVLVGVARDRTTLEPLPRAVVLLEPIPDSGADEAPDPGHADRSRVATATGAYWFCNVPAGRARIAVRADGYAEATSHAVIHAGTVSWYDALLRPASRRP